MTQVPQPIRIPLAVLAALLVSVTACSDTATAPDPQTSASDVLFAKGGNGGGGGGKPGGGGGAATTLGVFTGGVTADVDALEDGADKVSITLNNRLDVSTFEGNSKQEARQGFAHKLCTDMSNLVITNTVDRDAYLLAGGVENGILCSKSRMHTRNEDIDLDLLADGEIAHAGGKIVPRELDSNGAWDWRIIFDTSSLGTGGDDAIGAGLCVERTGATTWTFSNGCTASDGTTVDSDVELWRFNDGNPRMVAEFDMPFSFTVTSG